MSTFLLDIIDTYHYNSAMEKRHTKPNRRRPTAVAARLERTRREPLFAAAAIAAGLGLYATLITWLLV